jgi:hypothetical protein
MLPKSHPDVPHDDIQRFPAAPYDYVSPFHSMLTKEMMSEIRFVELQRESCLQH